MAFGVGDYLDKLNSFELAGVPIGAGVYYQAAEQLSTFVSGLISHFLPVPDIVSSGAAAYLFRLKPVEDFLGKYGSFYASMAAVGSGVDKQFNLSGEINKLLNSAETAITGGVSGVTGAISTQSPATTSTPTSGYVGEIPDIGDLAAMTSQYQDQFKEAE